MSVNTVAATGNKATFQAPPTISRTMLVHIAGSPASLQSLGGEAGSWGLTNEQAARIFTTDKSTPTEQVLNDIRNVILRRVRVLEYKTNAPDMCSLSIDGISG
eukprot:1307368-Rhodomonas_salina.3